MGVSRRSDTLGRSPARTAVARVIAESSVVSQIVPLRFINVIPDSLTRDWRSPVVPSVFGHAGSAWCTASVEGGPNGRRLPRHQARHREALATGRRLNLRGPGHPITGPRSQSQSQSLLLPKSDFTSTGHQLFFVGTEPDSGDRRKWTSFMAEWSRPATVGARAEGGPGESWRNEADQNTDSMSRQRSRAGRALARLLGAITANSASCRPQILRQ